MNIQTVIANLLNTIEGKEQMLASFRKTIADFDAMDDQCDAWLTATVTAQFLEINLKELNAILNDCMAVREADIVRELELNNAIMRGLEKNVG